MGRKRYSSDESADMLRELELLIDGGDTIGEASKKIGVTVQTYYRWRKKHGGMHMQQTKRLHDLEKENERLKRLVADLSVDNAILKEVSKGSF